MPPLEGAVIFLFGDHFVKCLSLSGNASVIKYLYVAVHTLFIALLTPCSSSVCDVRYCLLYSF